MVCNVEALPVSDPEKIRESLQEQVTGTVRWTESIEYLLDREHIAQFIELGPGGVLAGLVGRIRKDTEAFSISDTASVKAVAALLKA